MEFANTCSRSTQPSYPYADKNDDQYYEATTTDTFYQFTFTRILSFHQIRNYPINIVVEDDDHCLYTISKMMLLEYYLTHIT